MEQNTVAISTKEYRILKEMNETAIETAIQNARMKRYLLEKAMNEWKIEKYDIEKLTNPKLIEFGYDRESMIDLIELGITLDEMKQAIRKEKMECEELRRKHEALQREGK